jgi:short-subunit dehydrogenase
MSAENFKLDVAEQMINVNLTGALRVLKMVIPMLIQHQQGHIVLIGSIAGYRGLPNAIGYGASKAGLIHLAENLKCDLAQHNIKVQVINPGFVKTQLTDKNTFSMPFILSPEQAAKQIVTAMTNKSFESRFPFVFANGLKLLSKLPYWLYFYLIRKATGT